MHSSYDEPNTDTDSSFPTESLLYKIPDGIDVEFLPDVKEAHSGSSSTSDSHWTTNPEHPASVETDLNSNDNAVMPSTPVEDENVSSVEAVDEMLKPSPGPFNESNQVGDVKSELSCCRPRSCRVSIAVHGDSKPYGENDILALSYGESDSAALSYLGHREVRELNQPGIATRLLRLMLSSKSQIVPTFNNELCNTSNDNSSLPVYCDVKPIYVSDEIECADNTCSDNAYTNPPHTAESSPSRDTMRAEHHRGLKTNGPQMMLVQNDYVRSLLFTNSLNILPFTTNDDYPQDKWIPSCCLSILNDEQYLYHKSINETNQDCQKTHFVSGYPLPFLRSTSMAFYSELESKNSTSSYANENFSCGFESDDVKDVIQPKDPT